MSSVIVDVLREIFVPNRDRHAIPSLDGPWQPNSRLDDARDVATFEEPDDVVVHEGKLLVSSAAGVTGPGGLASGAAHRGPSGALASLDAQLAVGVSGTGVVLIGGPRAGTVLSETDGAPLKHPTACAFLDASTLLVTEGSQAEPVSRWVWDLMRKGSSGRLLRFDLASGRGTTLASNLAFPFGVVADGDRAIVTESWSHRLLSFPVRGGGKPKVLVPNFPGYPARIKPAAGGGYWLTFFAMRTQLVDFVLEETTYREAMLETIDPRWWIAPTLAAEDYFLEPCQGGGIKQLGIKKPWAPPRSYGLVVRVDASFDPLESLHSRVGGKHHGITAALEHEGGLYVVSKGHGKLIEVNR